MGRFDRNKPRYKPQPKVLVLCEDSKSALQYTKDARQHFRVVVEVEVSHCGKTDPKGIVEKAKQRRKNFDRIYCLIDHDGRDVPFETALTTAKNLDKVEVIASYPCFEFWLLLHFAYSRKSYARAEEVKQDLLKCDGMQDYDKGNTAGLFSKLLPKLPTAQNHAQKAHQAAQEEGDPNPSTELHLLLLEFEKLSKPLPLD